MRGRLGDLSARTHTPFYLAIEVEVKVQVQDMGKGVEGDAPCSGLWEESGHNGFDHVCLHLDITGVKRSGDCGG